MRKSTFQIWINLYFRVKTILKWQAAFPAHGSYSPAGSQPVQAVPSHHIPYYRRSSFVINIVTTMHCCYIAMSMVVVGPNSSKAKLWCELWSHQSWTPYLKFKDCVCSPDLKWTKLTHLLGQAGIKNISFVRKSEPAGLKFIKGDRCSLSPDQPTPNQSPFVPWRGRSTCQCHFFIVSALGIWRMWGESWQEERMST